jgi:Ricin-type beta-trefoil lectin domain
MVFLSLEFTTCLAGRSPHIDPDRPIERLMYAHLPDAELTQLMRVGTTTERESAVEELRRRHFAAVLGYARVCVSNDCTAEELAGLAFDRAVEQERRGFGDIAWRHCLLLTVQCLAVPWAAGARRPELVPGFAQRIDEVRDTLPDMPDPSDLEQHSPLLCGYRQLPPRAQAVLWHSVVESDSDARTAGLLGLDPSRIPELRANAQDKLRITYLRIYLEQSGSQECAGFIRIMEAVARPSDTSKARRSPDLDTHLETCQDCARMFGQLTALADNFRAVLAEGLFLWGGTAYISLRSDDEPTDFVPLAAPGATTAPGVATVAGAAVTSPILTVGATLPPAGPGPPANRVRSLKRWSSLPLVAAAALLAAAVATAATALVVGFDRRDGNAVDADPGIETTRTATVTATPSQPGTDSPPPPGDYRQLINVRVGLCLDVEDGVLEGHAEVVAARCSDSADTQKWLLDDEGLLRNFADAGFCLDPTGDSIGALGMARCGPGDGHDGQDLRFSVRDDGSIRPFIALDFALTPQGGSVGSEVRLERAAEPTPRAQRWRSGATASP